MIYALSLHASRRHHRLRSRHPDRPRRASRPGSRPSRAAAGSASSRASTRASSRSGSPARCVASIRRRSCRPRRRGGWTATSCSPSPPRRRRGTRRAIEEFDPARVGILVGSAIGGIATIAEQQQSLPRARGRPRLAVLHPVGARRHGERPDRDPARASPARTTRPVSACATGSTAIGEGAATIVRGQADIVLAGGTEAAITPLILAGFCAMRGPRGRGGRPDARDAPVRRDAGRLRDGGGGVHPRARGARVSEGPRRHDLRRGARLRRLERRAPPRPARARGNRGRGDDHRRARRRPASPPSASATSTRTAPRRRSATSPRRGRCARSSVTTRTSSRSRRRSRSPATASGPPARSRR